MTAGGSRRAHGVAPRLIVVTDLSFAPDDALLERIERVAQLAQRGRVMVQLRDKEIEARRRLAFGKRLSELCQRTGQWFSVNDRLDLAQLLDADAVHLGEASVATGDARRLMPQAWLSRACHDPSRVPLDVEGVLLSPIAAARKGNAALGMEALRAARAVLDCAVAVKPSLFALGGIDASNAAECLAAGADGVAVVGAVMDGRDPAGLVEALGIG